MKHGRAQAQARARAALAALAAGVLAATGCSSNFGDDNTEQDTGASQHVNVLIATSGDAETQAVKDAARQWEKKTGNTVTVQVASDINQQLSQGFSGGNPPDVFYVESDQFANYAEGGSLYAYGDQISDVDDFSASLRQSFTRDGELYCLPKDVSSLALVINTDLWRGAGLTEADYPTTWDELRSVAEKLTGDGVTGLVTSYEYQRLGVFMTEAGGWITNEDQTKMTADSEQNAEALSFVKGMLNDGSMKFAQNMDAEWAGEVFGEGEAAMTIEGPWLAGSMSSDYPDTDYKVIDLPEGPGGKGTLAYTTCWGIAQDSSHHEAAVDLVKWFTSTDQQVAASEAFGVIPSRESAKEEYLEEHPGYQSWAATGDWVQGPVTVKGFDTVLSQFNSDLQSLATSSPRTILADLQRYGEQTLEDSQ